MTLRQLEIFKAIVETGRFTSAAEKLYVAQPSVSQQIQTLEAELGELLLVRTRNRKVQLTEPGKILKEHADVILRQCEKARLEISALTKDPVGQIRIGIGGHQLTSMLPPALSEFHEKFPKVSVDLVNGTTPQLLESLKTNMLDLAVVTFLGKLRELRTEVLFTEDLVVVVRPSDPLAKKDSIAPEELGKLRLVLYDRSTSTRQRVDEFFARNNIAPRVIFELTSVEAMKRMVEAGMGATIIPRSALLNETGNQPLHALRIERAALTRTVGIAMPLLPRLPKVVDAMVTLIRKRFRHIKRLLDGEERAGASA